MQCWTSLLAVFLLASVALFAQARGGGVDGVAAATRPDGGAARGLVGNWRGALEVGAGLRLRLVLQITSGSAGLRGTVVSLDQGNTRMAASKVVETTQGVRVEIGRGAIVFEGKRSDDGLRLVGQWRQGGSTFPLELERTAEPVASGRPQDPKRPYPYAEEQVRVSSAGGVTLAGTLTLPRGSGPYPAVVLVTGTGPQDRDEAVMGHRPFLVLADHLTRQGIAVLRCDDRGVGGSTGEFAKATDDDFADDALAAVKYLRTRGEIDRIGLVGHSEGGIVVSQAAVRDERVAFVAMLAGPGVPMDELLARQAHDVAASSGWDESLLAIHDSATRRALELVKQEPDANRLAAKLRELYRGELAQLTEDQRRASGANEGMVEATVRFWQSPWMRQLTAYDPRPTLAKVRCPVLAINGEKDIQVAAKENLDAIRAAVTGGGNPAVTTVQLPGLNHMFQTCERPSTEYAKIEETFAPAALNVVSDWIRQQSGR